MDFFLIMIAPPVIVFTAFIFLFMWSGLSRDNEMK